VQPVATPDGLEYKASTAGPDSGLLDADDETGVVEAIVSVTGVEDDVADIIEPGAYAKTLARRRPKGIFVHDWSKWVARTEMIEELLPGDKRLPPKTKTGQPWPQGAGGLYVRARFNLNTPEGKSAYENVKFFSATGECDWSVGYKVPKGAGVRTKDGKRRIKEMDLYEYSPVLFGAAPLSGTLSVKTADATVEAEAPDVDWDDVELLAAAVETALEESGRPEGEPAPEGPPDPAPEPESDDSEEDDPEATLYASETGGESEPEDEPAEEDGEGDDAPPNVTPEAEPQQTESPDVEPAIDEPADPEGKAGGPPFKNKQPKSGSGASAETMDGKYKITDVASLKNAIKACGGASGDQSKLRAHIMKRAFALNRPDLIPDNWKKTDSGSKDDDTEGLETKRDFSTDRRKKLAKEGAALPDGSYPIKTVEDLRNAISAFGRAKPEDRDKVKAHIIKRARALGHPELIPDGWASKDSESKVFMPSLHPRDQQGRFAVVGRSGMKIGELPNSYFTPKPSGDVTVASLRRGDVIDYFGRPHMVIRKPRPDPDEPGDELALWMAALDDSGKPGMRDQYFFRPKEKLRRIAEKKNDADLTIENKLTHEPLDRSPKKNWVEMAGQLPAYIQHIAKDIHEEKGVPLDVAIPTAIAAVKRWAAGGGNVNPDTRAKAAAAVAEWEALKAKSHARSAAREVVRASKELPETIESEIYPYLPGTLEELRERIAATAAKEFVPDAAEPGDHLVDVVGTWSDRVVVTHYDLKEGGPPNAYEIPYRLSDDDVVDLGDPEPVILSVTVEGEEDHGEQLSPYPALVDSIVAGVKAELAGSPEDKAGRVLSGVNANRLRAAVEQLVVVLKAAGIEINEPEKDDGETEPEPAQTQDSTAPSARVGDEIVPAGKVVIEPSLVARAYRIMGDAASLPLGLAHTESKVGWDPKKHPRDRDGRFIQVGSMVHLPGTAENGVVTGPGDKPGTVNVNLADGSGRVEAKPSDLLITRDAPSPKTRGGSYDPVDTHLQLQNILAYAKYGNDPSFWDTSSKKPTVTTPPKKPQLPDDPTIRMLIRRIDRYGLDEVRRQADREFGEEESKNRRKQVEEAAAWIKKNRPPAKESPPSELPSLLSRLADTGGFSWSPNTGKAPKDGYMVALTGHTVQFDKSLLDDPDKAADAIVDYIHFNRDLFSTNRELYVGGWIEGGKLWLEPSERIEGREDAIKAGKERDQIAIFDVAAGDVIETGGKGGFLEEEPAGSGAPS
jgi:phage head maturation protease